MEDISVDDKPVDMAASLELKPGAHRLQFRFSGLSFIAPEKVHYRFRLKGYDPDWFEAGSRRLAVYTNLPPRKYVFEVMAANNDGVWNPQAASVDVVLDPYFYQTSYFYALLALVLGLVAWLAYHLRVKGITGRYDAVLAERTRIAREIHDTLAQGYVGVSLQLELISRTIAASPENAARLVGQAQEFVRKNLDEARQSIWDLRGQPGARPDLVKALRSALEDARRDSGLGGDLEVKGAYRPLPVATEEQLVKIGREALSNAVRHGQAQNIRLRLLFDPECITLLVQDDGCGFDQNDVLARDGHYGLVGMRERAESIGASFTLETAMKEGTTVSVKLFTE